MQFLSRSELHQVSNMFETSAIIAGGLQRDFEVATQSATKIASSCATKIAFVNGA